MWKVLFLSIFSINLNISSFESSFIAITGCRFYFDYTFKRDREEGGEKKNCDIFFKKGKEELSEKIFINMKPCCCHYFRTKAWSSFLNRTSGKKRPMTILKMPWSLALLKRSKLLCSQWWFFFKNFWLWRFLRRLVLFFQMPDCISIASGVVHSSGA